MEGGLRDRESLGFLRYLPPRFQVLLHNPWFGERGFGFLARDKRVGKVVFSFSYLTPESLMEKKELE